VDRRLFIIYKRELVQLYSVVAPVGAPDLRSEWSRRCCAPKDAWRLKRMPGAYGEAPAVRREERRTVGTDLRPGRLREVARSKNDWIPHKLGKAEYKAGFETRMTLDSREKGHNLFITRDVS